MSEIEKTHHLIVIGRYIGEGLSMLAENIIKPWYVIKFSYLHDLPKGNKNQVGWHSRRKCLKTASISCNQMVRTSSGAVISRLTDAAFPTTCTVLTTFWTIHILFLKAVRTLSDFDWS